MKKRVIVIAEGSAARAAIANVLLDAGYLVELVSRIDRGHEIARRGTASAAIILPTAYKRSTLEHVQRLGIVVPKIIILASQSADENVVRRLLPQASVLFYPCDDRRLLKLLEDDDLGSSKTVESLVRFAGRTLDCRERVLLDDQGREIPLSRGEFASLLIFLRNPNRTISRERLRRSVDGRGLEPYERSVDMLIGRLRRKIRETPSKPRLIVTVPTLGYKLAIPQGGVEWSLWPPASVIEQGDPVRSIERRHLAVMVAQIVGLGILASELDPEALQAVVDSVRQACSRVLSARGGTMVSLIGDNIHIYFGIPVAFEDDVYRAVRAGLELIDRIKGVPTGTAVPLRLRIGVATGLVVINRNVDSVVTGAVGEAASQALGLTRAAAPGTLLVSEGARRLVASFFVFEKAAPVASDGSKLSPVWRVVRARDIVDRYAVAASLIAPLAGRREEVAILQRRWSRACAGNGHIVLVSADAGMGKSRLVLELLRTLPIDAHFTLRFFGSAYEANASFSAAKVELEQAAGFLRTDTAEKRIHRLNSLLGHGADCGNETLASLCDLLSLPCPRHLDIARLDPQKRKERTISALLARVEALATRSPVLVIAEDAQWIDPSSMEFLVRLADTLAKRPIMLLVTARSEFVSPWQRHSRATTVSLRSLSHAASLSLVTSTAQQDTLPSKIANAIVTRCDGVPLFIEELTKAVLEAQAHTPADTDTALNPSVRAYIPETLRTSLQARLDRLGTAKEMVQIAAVIGREFSYGVLKRLAPPTLEPLYVILERLISSGLVFSRGVAPLASYVFKHALIRDAAYETLSRGRRSAVHAAIASILEEELLETGVSSELLAYHHERGGNGALAAGHLVNAAERSLAHAGLTEALTHLERAKNLLSALPSNKQRLQLELRLYLILGRALTARYGYTAPKTREAHQQVLKRSKALGHKSSLSMVNFGLWLSAWNAAEYNVALARAQELLARSKRDQHPEVRGVAHMGLGMTLTLTGDLLGARRHLTRALKIDSFGLPGEASHLFLAVNGRISSATYLHDCLLLLGEVDQADAMAKKAEAMALEVQNSASRQPYSQALAQNHLLRMHVFRGETDKATALSSTLLKLSDEHKYLYFSGTSVIYMGWALAQQGNLREAISLWHRGVKQLRAIGALCWLPRYFVLLAEYYSQIGNPEPGLEAISQAHETIGRTGERGWHAEVFRLEGQLLLHKSRRTRLAQRCFERAIKTAQAQRARLFELRAATCLAELLLRTGQTADGYNALASVCAQFSSRHTNADVRRAHALLKALR